MSESIKKSFFFYELHLLNLPYALLLKCFGDVYVYKYQGKCQYFLKNNFFPSINDFSDVDQWVKQKKVASGKLKENFLLIQKQDSILKVKNLKLNLEKIQIQKFCIEYEQYVLFTTLIGNHVGEKHLIDYFFRSFLKKNYPELLIHEEELNVLSSFFMDNVHYAFNSLKEISKIIFRLFLSKKASNLKHSYKYICSGISSSEFPENDNELNFSWLVTNNILNSNDVLYILNSPPSKRTENFLASKNIQFVTKSSLFAAIPFLIKTSITWDIFKNTTSYLFRLNFKNKIILHSFIDTRSWLEVFTKLAPKYYINSFSVGWPETFETLLCGPMKIKSILWFYSAGEFLYSTSNSSFNDQGTRFCINESSEIWVWNNLVKKLFEERSLNNNHSSNIEVIGPILNGDWGVFNKQKNKQEALTISVFDLTPMKARMRLNYGEGPFCNTELQEKFYQGILKIYQTFPDIKIVIKTKRHHDPLVYDLVPTLKMLIESKLERIIFLPANSNPYQAIADSDLVISVPYTSPTMMALSFGIAGIYYDPIGLCNYTFQDAFKHLTIKNEIELIQHVKNYKAAEFKDEIFPVISINEIENKLKEKLK